jgi:small conductance mechanosensitive channel
MIKKFSHLLILISFSLTLFFSAAAIAQSPQAVPEKAKEPIIKFKEVDPPQSLEEVAVEQVQTFKKLIDIIIEFFVKYSFQVMGGLIVLALGWFIGGFISKKLLVFFEKKQFDITVSKFIAHCVKLMVLVFAAIVALGKFGIEIAPLIAGLSVAGFGLSFALQGPLANYAAGVSLIFTKPFKVGDIVEVAGRTGEVLEIKIPRTEMRTVDGELIMIPNNHIVGEIIHNCSSFKRVDIDVGVAYDADVQLAINIIKEIIKNDKRIEHGEKTSVGIKTFGDSSVNLHGRVWCPQEVYWEVLFDLNKKIFDTFNQKGIVIPFPQSVVHLQKDGA